MLLLLLLLLIIGLLDFTSDWCLLLAELVCVHSMYMHAPTIRKYPPSGRGSVWSGPAPLDLRSMVWCGTVDSSSAILLYFYRYWLAYCLANSGNASEVDRCVFPAVRLSLQATRVLMIAPGSDVFKLRLNPIKSYLFLRNSYRFYFTSAGETMSGLVTKLQWTFISILNGAWNPLDRAVILRRVFSYPLGKIFISTTSSIDRLSCGSKTAQFRATKKMYK